MLKGHRFTEKHAFAVFSYEYATHWVVLFFVKFIPHTIRSNVSYGFEYTFFFVTKYNELKW